MAVRIADASVVGAWCFQEDRADEALELMQQSEVCVPSLLAYELTNIAWKKIAHRGEPSAFVAAGLRLGLMRPFTWLDVDHVAVLELASSLGVSAYDGAYLYLARDLGATLLTFDRRLAQAAQSL